jgi:hypothetical protein
MRQILESDPERLVLALAAIAGVSRALDRASLKSLGDHLPLVAVLGLSIIGGALSGLLLLYLYGFLVRWTGRWFGGSGSAPQLRAAIAWPNVITCWALLLWVPQLLLFGNELFTTETPRLDADPGKGLLLLGFFSLEIVVALWFIVVFLKCVSEVQGFSAWTALANALVAGLVMVAPFVVLRIVIAVVAS